MLSIRNLDLYYGDAQALDDVSLDVGRGEIVAIVGANGAGKSSLIRCIAGMEPPRSGKISFQEKDITGRESHHICNLGIGQVAEGRQVFPTLTVLENLEMGAYLRPKADLKQEFERVYGLFPLLYERRKQLAGTLSGGEQQMLAMARAMMMNPEVVLLDEPSMGLAPILVDEVFRIISRLRAEGMTMLLVEQFAAAALEVADYGYVMENGRIAVHGPAQKLKNDPAVKAAYLGGSH